MTADNRGLLRVQFSIRAALLATCGVAGFIACSRILIEIGVPGVLVSWTVIPGAIGTFCGLATKTGQRNALLGSLMGCAVCLSLPLVDMLLVATAGLAQSSYWHTTMGTLGLFSLVFTLCFSGIVGWVFAVFRGSRYGRQSRTMR